MKLLTQEIRKRLPALGEHDGDLEAQVVCKFFDPSGSWTWYVFEGSPVCDDDGNEVDFEFFGLVDGFEKELGYFWLSQLQSIRGAFGLGIERDLHYRFETKRELFNRHGLTYLTEDK